MRGLHEHRQAERRRPRERALAILAPVIGADAGVAHLRHAQRGHQVLEQHLVHAHRGCRHARADVGHAERLEHAPGRCRPRRTARAAPGTRRRRPSTPSPGVSDSVRPSRRQVPSRAISIQSDLVTGARGAHPARTPPRRATHRARRSGRPRAPRRAGEAPGAVAAPAAMRASRPRPSQGPGAGRGGRGRRGRGGRGGCRFRAELGDRDRHRRTLRRLRARPGTLTQHVADLPGFGRLAGRRLDLEARLFEGALGQRLALADDVGHGGFLGRFRDHEVDLALGLRGAAACRATARAPCPGWSVLLARLVIVPISSSAPCSEDSASDRRLPGHVRHGDRRRAARDEHFDAAAQLLEGAGGRVRADHLAGGRRSGSPASSRAA